MKEFQQGQMIKTLSGDSLKVIQKLGEGGQGVVYKVEYKGKEKALKWYFANKLHNPDDFYKNLQRNIKNGSPNKAFLWPEELTEHFDESFGYIMNLRPAEYKDFGRILLAKEHFSNLYTAIDAALCIVNGFRVLHNNGYSYQDLNDGNFFVNPNTGDVLICDNDNVAPFGKSLGIAGKCRYMAPEIVLGMKCPDIHTDRFSLAVILYLLLFLNHPLEGKRTMCPCMTEELEFSFYGKDAVFVYDPNNDSNRPVKGIHTNELKFWPLYPEFIQTLFERSFSRDAMVGKDVEHRVMEKDWEEAFINLKGSVMKCPFCGNEIFINPALQKQKCIHCGKIIERPLMLKVKKYTAVLVEGAKLYACHVKHDSSDFRTVMGEVVSNKTNPKLLGLKNCSGFAWEAILPNGDRKPYEEGKVFKLGAGLKINLGNGNIAEIF